MTNISAFGTIRLFAGVILISFHLSCTHSVDIITYPAPGGELPSADYSMTVNDKPVFVYQARVSAVPVNQVWPGYQRPQEQTEIASFAYCDFSGTAAIKITSLREIKTVTIRPQSYGIKPVVSGNTISFTVEKPRHLVLEVNGWHFALHLFLNPPETWRPSQGDSNIVYFGPGVHRPGIMKMRSDETIYIAGGAIVHGVIEATDCSNIKILGRGILDASTIKRGEARDMIALSNCTNIEIEGIICRDPHVWTITPLRCQAIAISNVKLIGLWRYNADGIDICNSRDVTVKDCFIRSFDDSIVLKGLRSRRDSTDVRNVQNISAHDCVIWNDWGRALEFGAETVADTMSNIVFKDIDIVHHVHIAMDIQNGDRAVVHDVLFEDIRVEEPIVNDAMIADDPYHPEDIGRLFEMNIRKNFYSKDSVRGKIYNIHFKNISFSGSTNPKSILTGYDADHAVEKIIFENVSINGKRVANANDCNLTVNDFARWIIFK